jgi:hypothetical protein
VRRVFFLLILSLAFCTTGYGQLDSVSTAVAQNVWPGTVQEVLEKNKFLNNTQAPVAFIVQKKEREGKELHFYLITAILLVFGFLKIFYAKYFNNLFRLYFNTSLRHNQLTDLILQAKLSSLIFNIYFFVTAGIYLYFVLSWFNFLPPVNIITGITLSILLVAAVYTMKYFGLLFLGWIAGMQHQADVYIFVTFLINKLLGICLLPFLVVIAFSSPMLVQIAITGSLAVVALFWLSRYLRSYGLLARELKISGLHFLIYILAVEIVPLLLIYKGITRGIDMLA